MSGIRAKLHFFYDASRGAWTPTTEKNDLLFYLNNAIFALNK